MKVVLVDDSPQVRATLRRIIEAETEYEVVAEAGGGDEAVQEVARHRPDLILLDVTMPGMSGTETTIAIHALDPTLPVVALSSFADAANVSSMMAAGARGYLLKNAPPSEIVAGLRAAVVGRPMLAPDVLRQVLGDLSTLYREQRDRAEGLAEIDRMKRTFLSLVNDQLRTPLTAITGALVTLEHGWERLDDAMKREFLASVSTQAERMTKRIEQIAMVANLSRDTPVRERAPFGLDGVAREVCVGLGHRYSDRVLSTKLQPVVVTGDRSAALTVAGTLLENAAEHTAGDVELRVVRREGWGMLTVRDHGPGMTAEELARLAAEPFEPGDASDTREVGGLGLSLYLARRLLELDGGHLDVVSDPESGSIFSAVLPLAPDLAA